MKKYLLATFFLIVFVCLTDPGKKLLSNLLLLEQPTRHTIEEGDWLSKISLQYYGDPSYWKELELINRAPNGNRIYPGEEIIVPSFEAIQKVRRTKRMSAVNELVKVQQEILASNETRTTQSPERLSQNQPKTAAPTERATKPQSAETQRPAQSNEVAKSKPAPAPTVSERSQPATEQTQPNSDVAVVDETAPEYLTEPESESAGLDLPLIFGIGALVLVTIVGLFFFLRNRKQDEEVSYYGRTREDEIEEDETEKEEASRRPSFLVGKYKDTENDDDDQSGERNKNGSRKKVEAV